MNAQLELLRFLVGCPAAGFGIQSRNGFRAGRLACVWMVVCLVLLPAAVANGEATTKQTYRVVVPVSSTISTPAKDVVVEDFDQSSGEFPEQVWKLESNSPSGLLARFSVNEAFTHERHPSIQHDARLRVHVDGAAGDGVWTAIKPEDTTSQSSGDLQAGVEVQCDAPGRANIGLVVSVVDDFHSMIEGRYSTTVVCTISMP